MDTISLLLVFCILCSSVGGGLSVPRTRHNAGNEICSWQTLESFQQDSSNSLYPYVLLSLEESPRVSPSDDNACKVISLKTLGMDTLTRRSWAVSETEITNTNRLQKVRIKLENSKVYIDGTWFRREIDKGETEHVKLEMQCVDNSSALIRKCAVFSLRNNVFSHKMDHIQRGRVLLQFAEENEVTDSSVLSSVEDLLVCVGVGVFSLIVILFLCTKRTCAKTLQNESYMEEEIIVNSTGSYHVKVSTSEQVDEERPEEVAQPETQTQKHERTRSASRESGIDEDTQQEGNEEKQLRHSTSEQENQDVQPENSELLSNSLAVAVTNTDSTSGIYEEVTKESDSSRPRQSLEVSSCLSQSGTEAPSVNLDS